MSRVALWALVAASLQACVPRATIEAPSPEATWWSSPDAPFRQSAPPPLRTARRRHPGPLYYQLDNGMQLIVVRRPELPTTSLTYVNRLAPGELPAYTPMLAKVTALSLRHGTQLEDGRQVRALSAAGSEPSAATTRFGTVLNMTLLSPYTAAGIEVMGLVVQRPLHDEGSVASARRDALEALANRSGTSGSVLEDLANKAFFGEGHPLVRSAEQRVQSALAVTVDDVRRFHRTRYRPDASALVVVGSVDPMAVLEDAKRHWGDWRATGNPMPGRAQGSWQPKTDHEVFGLRQPHERVSVQMVLPAPPVHDADYAAMKVLCALLNTRAGVQSTLRHERGAAYDVSCQLDPFPGGSRFNWVLDVHGSELLQSADAMRSQLGRLRSELVSEEDLTVAITSARRELDSASNAQLSLALARDWSMGRGESEDAELDRDLTGVTAEQLRLVAISYLDPDQARWVLMGRLGRYQNSIRRLGRLQLHQLE